MKSAILALALLSLQTPAVMPKNNPSGIWESATGTQYKLQLSGTELKVELVSGSNPGFVAYAVDLKNTDEPNTYLGSGSFTRKVKIHDEDKECKFTTTWQLTVVSNDRILGATSYIDRDPESCAVKERHDPPNDPTAAALDLKRK